MSGTLVLDSAQHAAERARGERWVLGGLAAGLARRLDANVGVIRVLLILAAWFEPWTLTLYGVAAVLLPHGERRLPGWSGLVAVGRFGLFWLVAATSTPGLPVDAAFALGPEIWLPLGGVALVGLILLLTSAPDEDTLDEDACHDQVLAALPVVALCAALVIGMALVPALRWEWLAGVAAVAAGVLVLLSRASVVLAATLAAVVVFFAGAGARFDGGIGSQRLLPERGGDMVVRRAAGTVVVDLRRIRSGPVRLEASVGVGRLQIVLPQEADVTTRLRVGRGAISTRDGRTQGVDVRRFPTGTGTTRRRIAVTIDAEVGVGELRIGREGGYMNARGI